MAFFADFFSVTLTDLVRQEPRSWSALFERRSLFACGSSLPDAEPASLICHRLEQL